MTRPKTLVIGIGNRLRGDDGVGPLVADRITDLQLPNVDSLSAPQLTPELAHTLSQYAEVFFVDAVWANSETANTLQIQLLDDEPDISVHSHLLSPASLTRLSLSLFGHRPQSWIVRISVMQCDHGDVLTDQAVTLAEKAVYLLQMRFRQ